MVVDGLSVQLGSPVSDLACWRNVKRWWFHGQIHDGGDGLCTELLLPAVMQPVGHIISGRGGGQAAFAFARQAAHDGVGHSGQAVKAAGTHQFNRAVHSGMGLGLKKKKLRGTHPQNDHRIPLFACWRA